MNPVDQFFIRKLKFKSKPSYGFLLLLLLPGIFFFPVGLLISLGIGLAVEMLLPQKPIETLGLIRNRTKIVLNLYAIAILCFLILLSNSTADGEYLGTDERRMINMGCTLLAAWIGYQAYVARRVGHVRWMWIFGCFAVALLPFLHFNLGPFWTPIDVALVILLIVSSFTFRFPARLPAAKPIFTAAQPELKLEEELIALKRLLDSGLLTQSEFEEQRQAILRRKANA